jgi:SAM-dependent methyltransferase
MVLYAVTVFLSAFLLFQVQPIIAKMVLPWFGGSSAVWTTCMLFFQMALLAGYAYAHWLHSRIRGWKQAALHSALLVASLAALPIIPTTSWKSVDSAHPAWRLLGLLAATVGLPYFLLATTSPLVQAWYTRANKGAMPYRLFALSNLASMLALLSYPPLVEPNLTTRAQALLWSASYGCFVILCAAIAWSVVRRPVVPGMAQLAQDSDGEMPTPRLRVLWMSLAACASILLLSVTTFLTQDVAPIPFLWIVPLSVYLLSFIICFEAPRLYWRPLYYALLPIALVLTADRIWLLGRHWPIVPTIAGLSAALFVFCMVCHGELAGLKPHPRHLTGFYLMVSLGGAAGGLFVGLVAPNIFRAYTEFPLGLALCAALAILLLFRRGALRRPSQRVGMLAAAAGYLFFLGMVIRSDIHGYRALERNFYGRLSVFDDVSENDAESSRKLMHGIINHGIQPLRPEYRMMPVSYFCPNSGIGLVMRSRPASVPQKVGILGLGCGTLLAYGRRGDTYRIYEINPLVLDLARSQFTYLRDAPAKVEIVMGDGRLSLEREPNQQFDVLVMDAFSGDSVPVHLLTREAFAIYFRHLKPDGVLAVNISNRHLDFKPVVESAASDFGKIALVFEYEPEDDELLCYACSWALIMDRSTRDRFPGLHSGKVLRADSRFREWTDDYSNMHRILR